MSNQLHPLTTCSCHQRSRHRRVHQRWAHDVCAYRFGLVKVPTNAVVRTFVIKGDAWSGNNFCYASLWGQELSAQTPWYNASMSLPKEFIKRKDVRRQSWMCCLPMSILRTSNASEERHGKLFRYYADHPHSAESACDRW